MSDLTVAEAKRLGQLGELFVELEWRRCALDVEYFLANYVYITVPPKVDARGKMKFQLWDYQLEALRTFQSNRYTVCVKARQLGFTTLAMGLVLHDLMFVRGTNDLIVSRTQVSASKNLGMVSDGYTFLPEWMKVRCPALVKSSELKLEFAWPDGQRSFAKSAAATKGVFAGETATRLVADEMALWDEPDAYRTLVPTTDAGGSIILISTARGPHNDFARLYRGAKRGENAYAAIFEPWWKSRFNTQATYDSKLREHAAEPWRFYAEYPSTDEEAFRESGTSRFPKLPDVSELENFEYVGSLTLASDTGKPEFVPDDAGPVRLVTLDPEEDGWYYIGADPSKGSGGDSHGAHLLQVCPDGRIEIIGIVWSNTLSPVEFAEQLNLLGRMFAGQQWAAMLGVEDQGGWGQLPIKTLQDDLLYPNPYVHRTVGQRRRSKGPKNFSMPMTEHHKKPVIDKLAEYVVPRTVGHRDLGVEETWLVGMYPELHVQLTQFVSSRTPAGGVKYGADAGCHDDLVMSLAIALWMATEAGPGRDRDEDVDDDQDASPLPRIGDMTFPTMRAQRAAAIEEAEAQAYGFAARDPWSDLTPAHLL